MKIWNFGVNALQLHLFCPHISFIENAAVKTAAFSRLTTEIPQTDFCFDRLKGTLFRKECPFLFTVPQNLTMPSANSKSTQKSGRRLQGRADAQCSKQFPLHLPHHESIVSL